MWRRWPIRAGHVARNGPVRGRSLEKGEREEDQRGGQRLSERRGNGRNVRGVPVGIEGPHAVGKGPADRENHRPQHDGAQRKGAAPTAITTPRIPMVMPPVTRAVRGRAAQAAATSAENTGVVAFRIAASTTR